MLLTTASGFGVVGVFGVTVTAAGSTTETVLAAVETIDAAETGVASTTLWAAVFGFETAGSSAAVLFATVAAGVVVTADVVEPESADFDFLTGSDFLTGAGSAVFGAGVSAALPAVPVVL